MKLYSAGGRIFCALMICIGLGMVVWNAKTVVDGVRLEMSGQSVEARIVDKHIERPHNQNRVRWESLTVNGTTVRHWETYLYDYFLTVAYTVDEVSATALAPVGYDRWHEEAVGSTITVSALPDVNGYVDAADRGMLYYGLRRIGIGLAIALVGFVAFRLQDE